LQEITMPIIAQWELNQYQFAAEQMCQRLCVPPHQTVSTPEGAKPAWMLYAERMHELRLMADLLRQSDFHL
jgi:hypothetical protein